MRLFKTPVMVRVSCFGRRRSQHSGVVSRCIPSGVVSSVGLAVCISFISSTAWRPASRTLMPTSAPKSRRASSVVISSPIFRHPLTNTTTAMNEMAPAMINCAYMAAAHLPRQLFHRQKREKMKVKKEKHCLFLVLTTKRFDWKIGCLCKHVGQKSFQPRLAAKNAAPVDIRALESHHSAPINHGVEE